MRRFVVITWLWTAALIVPADLFGRPATFQFVNRPPQRGQKSIVDSLFQLKLKISVKPNGGPARGTSQDYQRRQRKYVIVHEAGKDGPAKVRVYYKTAEEVEQTDGGQEQIKKDATAGKAYFVTDAAGKTLVTDAGGKPVAEGETNIVRHDNQDVGRRTPMAELLDGRTLAVGDTITLGAEQARELMGLAADVGRVRKFAMTLSGTRQAEGFQCAVFQTEIQINSEAIGSVVTAKGEYLIGIGNCRLVSLDLSGGVTIAGNRDKLAVEGTGTVRIAVKADYVQ